MGEVLVDMKASTLDGLPMICLANESGRTKIEFIDLFGDLPPMKVIRKSANTRQFPTGSEALALSTGSGDGLLLHMATEHRIICSSCSACSGKLYLLYEDAVSAGINVVADGARDAISSALANIDLLTTAGWTNLTYNVSIQLSNGDLSDQICHSDYDTTTTIKLYSEYGNLPFLGLLDGTYYNYTTPSSSTVVRDLRGANLTLYTNAAGDADKVFVCSNQGTCNPTKGVCQCFASFNQGVQQYRAISSDGHGNPGGNLLY